MEERNQSGGLIPYFVKNNKIFGLFMRPSDPKFGGPFFQISKGRLEPGEDILEGSLRESQEELGIKLKNLSNIIKIDTFFVQTANGYDYDLTVFIGKYDVPEDLEDFCFETGEVKWMELGEIQKRGRKNQMEIIEKAFDMIKLENEIE